MIKLQTQTLIWLGSEKGAAIVEYALLVILIAIVALIAVVYLGEETSQAYSVVADSVADASG